MANIFRVSHILPTYFMSLQSTETKAKYEKRASLFYASDKKKIKQKKETKSKFLKTCDHYFKLYFVNSRAINERLNKQKFEK